METNTLHLGDNLSIMQGMPDGCIDLICTDPPFNTGRDWVEFDDRWDGGLEGYLKFMKPRLIECHRLLKDTGSLYLHCDTSASHYLKVMLDEVFGRKNFRNEIVWKRDMGSKTNQYHKRFHWGNRIDIILFYTISDNYEINPYRLLTKTEIHEKFKYTNDNGEVYHTTIPVFRHKNGSPRPNLCFEWRGFTNPYPSGWRLCKERVEEEYQNGNIVILPNGKLERRMYLKDYKGMPYGNLWDDISRTSKLDYPTQKPVALYARMIEASSNQGDVVLDAFCGSGTTLVASNNLGRYYIGIDKNETAINIAQDRLKQLNLFTSPNGKVGEE